MGIFVFSSSRVLHFYHLFGLLRYHYLFSCAYCLYFFFFPDLARIRDNDCSDVRRMDGSDASFPSVSLLAFVQGISELKSEVQDQASAPWESCQEFP